VFLLCRGNNNLTGLWQNMSHYYFGDHHRLRHKFVKRVKILSVLVGGLLILIAGGVIFDVFINRNESTKTTDSTLVTKATFQSTSQIFRTAFFQFQAPHNWTSIPTETTPNKFVYRSLNKQLVLQELDIYVNSPLVDKLVTYVLPIKVDDSGFTPLELSQNCRSVYKPGSIPANPEHILFQGLRIYCNHGSPDFVVQIGSDKGEVKMHLKRPDGSYADYQLIFSDVTALPNDRDLRTILPSFQTR
jgi:hypothetical protein